MMGYKKKLMNRRRVSFFLFTSAFLLLSLLAGCGPSEADLDAVDYTPLAGDDWAVSTPEAEGMDPGQIAELYYNAAQLESIYGLLVIKNGRLIAEDYFNDGQAGQKTNVQSVAKSLNSALVGIAIEQGCLNSVNQNMMEFFPDLSGRIRDPRKEQITVREMLQMRAGYPWEESDSRLWEALFIGDYVSNIASFPLIYDPGSGFQYSNLTSHWLGVIVARACETDLKSFAEEHLLEPLGVEVGQWRQDKDGYYLGFAELHMAARDMAKLGLLYLNDGEYAGNQIVPAGWVHDSLQIYTEDAWPYRVGPHFQINGYGYQWWSVQAGDHHYNLAWGHGGQQIVLLDEFDMVIVVTADPQYQKTGDEPWQFEKENLNLVADFVSSLPSE